jgi:hypothetical protein
MEAMEQESHASPRQQEMDMVVADGRSCICQSEWIVSNFIRKRCRLQLSVNKHELFHMLHDVPSDG